MVCWCHNLFPFETCIYVLHPLSLGHINNRAIYQLPYRFTNTQRGKSNGEAFIEVANYICVLIGSFEAVVP